MADSGGRRGCNWDLVFGKTRLNLAISNGLSVVPGSDAYYAWWVIFSTVDKLYQQYANYKFQMVMDVIGTVLIVISIGLIVNQYRTVYRAEVIEYSYKYSSIKPKDLMEELAQSGVKYTADDVIMVTKTPDGSLLWLEKGNVDAGLHHIFYRHTKDFAGRNIKSMDILSFLHETLQTTPFNRGIGSNGPFAEYMMKGKSYTVAYGTNGFIVSFYPS